MKELTFKTLGLAKSFLLRAMTRRLAESWGCSSGWTEDKGIYSCKHKNLKIRINRNTNLINNKITNEHFICKSRVSFGEERFVQTRESRTSITRSESLRRFLMARVAAAIWPGYQLMPPASLVNPISPIAFCTIFFEPIFFFSQFLSLSSP